MADPPPSPHDYPIAPGARYYRKWCPACGAHYQAAGVRSLRCLACRGSVPVKVRTPRGARAHRPAPEGMDAAPPPVPPAWASEPSPPLTHARIVPACVGCRHGRAQPAAELGWECLASMARACRPLWEAARFEAR